MGQERLIIEISENGARLVSRNVKEIGKEAKEANPALEALKRTLEFAGVALTIREIVSRMAEFSNAISRAGLAAGASKEQLARLSDETQRLGRETGEGAIESARALAVLERTGLATAESTGALKDALELSTVAEVNAAEGADSLARAMNAFGLDASKAAQTADVLAVAFTKSNQGIGELTAGITHAAASARAAGLGLAETAALTNVLGKSGANARLLVHELGQALEALEAPTAAERAAFQALGLDIDKLRPSAVGLATVMEELGKKSGSFKDLEVRGGHALDILAQRTPQVRDMLKALEGSEGAAAKFAHTVEDSLAGALKLVKAAGDDLILAFNSDGGLATSLQLTAQAITNIGISVRAVKRETQGFFEFLLLSRNQLDELAKLRAAEAKSAAGEKPATAGTGGVVEIGGKGPDIFTTTEAGDRFPATSKKSTGLTEELRRTKELNLEQIQYRDSLATIESLKSRGLITGEQYNIQLGQAIEKVRTTTDALTSLKGKFLEIDTSIGQVSGQIGDSLVGAIDKASGALADFAISGFRDVQSLKKALSALLADLGKEILQLIIKTLILKAIQATVGGYFGGSSGAAGGAVSAIGGGASIAAGGGSAAGGPVYEGQTRLVGENGPELFRPPSNGTIIPNSQIGSGAAVNVKVVNVRDPKEVHEAMATAEGEKIIMNTLSKNRRIVQQFSR